MLDVARTLPLVSVAAVRRAPSAVPIHLVRGSYVARRHHAPPCRSARRIARPRGRHCRVGRPPQRRERSSERAADRAVGANAPDREGWRLDGGLFTSEVRTRLGGRGPEQMRHAERHPAPRPAPRQSTAPGTNGCVDHLGRARRPLHRDRRSATYAAAARAVDIDHVVALGDAWQTGARALGRDASAWRSPTTRSTCSPCLPRRTAQKGDADAAAWLPANKAYRCAYVARQLAVKLKYALWATRSERGAMQRVLINCPTLRLPAAGRRPIDLATTSDPAPPPASPPASCRA